MPTTILDEHDAWRLIRRMACLDWASFTTASPEMLGFEAWKAGINVQRGGQWRAEVESTPAASQLLDRYLPLVTEPAPFTIAQLGQSIDGRIATACGHSHYVTGPESLVHLHRLRALVDAVIVGAGTVAADDPQLTVRHVEGENPVRVVLDPQGRVDSMQQIFQAPQAPTLHIVACDEAACNRATDSASHVTVLKISGSEQGIAPRAVLDALAARGLKRVLIEGGGVTVSRFLAAGCLHRLQITVAPIMIGSGRPALTLPQIDTLDEALRPPCRIFPLGDDVLFDFTLMA
ncbi:RibD family protein [Phytohalomonas tamaricis]|uniref:RibD family protein n=1 Tax=Phytohalomonas tamaricis TaxID=2081032 RepID=UPI000D0B4CD7|nr:RibD family protein [Phytohalomonas tamaricis]